MVRLSPVWMTSHPPSVLWHCWLGHQTCKNRRPYNLYCDGADVKPCSINQSINRLWTAAIHVNADLTAGIHKVLIQLLVCLAFADHVFILSRAIKLHYSFW